MAKLSRVGDANEVGGKILKGSGTVLANGKPVGLHVSPITPHRRGKKHKISKTVSGSPNVFVEGVPVLRVGSGTTCGHKIATGSSNIYVS
jgi:uncharacterized Zn-binding protein involved in type VI secretion